MNAGLVSLAVRFPTRVMGNDYWRKHHPDMVSGKEQHSLNRELSKTKNSDVTAAFDRAMEPYLSDPFRGAKERRWLAEDEDTLTLEVETANEALAAADWKAADIDLCISCAFPPSEDLGVGHAAYIAQRMGLKCSAWNIESACVSGVVALETAAALVRAGQASKVLIVISCSYSLRAPTSEPISLSTGDGFCAMLVGETHDEGIIASYTTCLTETCGSVSTVLDLDENGQPCMRLRLNKGVGQRIREFCEERTFECINGVLKKAGKRIEEIDYFAFNGSFPWLVPFYIEVLGLSEQTALNTSHKFANTGPVLVPTSLFYGAHEGKIPENGNVILFGMANAGNASAILLKWGSTSLGPVHVPI